MDVKETKITREVKIDGYILTVDGEEMIALKAFLGYINSSLVEESFNYVLGINPPPDINNKVSSMFNSICDAIDVSHYRKR